MNPYKILVNYLKLVPEYFQGGAGGFTLRPQLEV